MGILSRILRLLPAFSILQLPSTSTTPSLFRPRFRSRCFAAGYLALLSAPKNLPFQIIGVGRVCHLTSASKSSICFPHLLRSHVYSDLSDSLLTSITTPSCLLTFCVLWRTELLPCHQKLRSTNARKHNPPTNPSIVES